MNTIDRFKDLTDNFLNKKVVAAEVVHTYLHHHLDITFQGESGTKHLRLAQYKLPILNGLDLTDTYLRDACIVDNTDIWMRFVDHKQYPSIAITWILK